MCVCFWVQLLKVVVLPSSRKGLIICFTGRVHFELSFCISTYFSILITQFRFGKILGLTVPTPASFSSLLEVTL